MARRRQDGEGVPDVIDETPAETNGRRTTGPRDRLWLITAAVALVFDAVLADGFAAAHLIFGLAVASPPLIAHLVRGRVPGVATDTCVALAWLTSAAALIIAGGWGFAPWLLVPALITFGRGKSGRRRTGEILGLTVLAAMCVAVVMRGAAVSFDFGVLAWASVVVIAVMFWDGIAHGAAQLFAGSRPDIRPAENTGRETGGDEAKALAVVERERDDALAAIRARSRFFADMSHELRTPLNAVLGFSEVMQLKLFGPMPAKYAEYADLIHESAKHLLDLIGDVLDVNKIEEGRYELDVAKFDARDAVNAVGRLMRPSAEGKSVKLEIVPGDDVITVEADLRALKQMLLNLASNAVKFTPAGGVVTISVRAEGDALVAQVADTGPGLTPEEMARIGRPYEQTERGKQHEGRSSGLGLALVRSLSELHGGALEIESVVGEGSVFRVRLPVLVDGATSSPSMDARGRLQRVKAAGFGERSGGRAGERVVSESASEEGAD